jgi:DnaJ family protein C protein 28
MDKWRGLVDEQIQRGMDEGAFDNLPGKGEPLRLDDDNPFEDPSERMGYRLLRNNGFTLPWIQEQKEIGQETERLRAELARAWARAERARATGRDAWPAELRWRKAATTFRQQVAELNERIRRYNTQAPAARFYRALLDAERELERVAQPLAAAAATQTSVAESGPPQSGARHERRARLGRLRRLWQTLRARLTGRSLLRAAHAAAFQPAIHAGRLNAASSF